MRKAKQKPKCRSCERLGRKLDQVTDQLIEATGERKGYDQARGGEVEFYRGLLKDLVDDYLIRRNPFVVEAKP